MTVNKPFHVETGKVRAPQQNCSPAVLGFSVVAVILSIVKITISVIRKKFFTEIFQFLP